MVPRPGSNSFLTLQHRIEDGRGHAQAVVTLVMYGLGPCLAHVTFSFFVRTSISLIKGQHDLVLAVVASSTLTAYDAEFVALANVLSVPLVTANRAVLKAFPDRALTMEAFVVK